MWSKALAPGYPDHPPMVALWIAAGTALAGDGTFGVRLLAPVAAAFGSVLLHDAAEDLLPGRRAGIPAALMLNATLLLGAGGVTMTPDTPLLFFWTMTLWALGRLHRTGRGEWWLVAGVAAGLAMDSKYSALFLAPVALLWLLLAPQLRSWLRGPWPWGAAGLAAGLFAPVLAWNAAHEWVSLIRQGGRAGDWDPARAAQFLLELAAGQIGLATPLLAILFVSGVAAMTRAACARRDPGPTLLALATVLPSAVFVEHALGDRVQANWPAIIYPAAAIAAAGAQRMWRRLGRAAVALGVALTVTVWIQGMAASLPLPRRIDPTLARLGGWPAFAHDVAEAADRVGAGYIACGNYGLAAMLTRLLPGNLPVIGIDPRWPFFHLPPATALLAGKAGLLVVSTRNAPPGLAGAWRQALALSNIPRQRNGVTAETYYVYKVSMQVMRVPAAIMPRPEGRP